MSDVVDRVVFHEGELAAQREAGLTGQAERVRPIIASAIPRGAVDFLRRQRMLVLGAQDGDGRMWATSLHGPAGFLSAPDPHALRVTARLPPADPLADVLRDQVDVGTLAIDLATRRRFRINGRWRPTGGGAEVRVHQAFGNCPKYIQARELREHPPAGSHPVVTRAGALPELVGGAGLVVTDPENLAETLQQWVAQPDRCRALGDKARQRVLDRYVDRAIALRTLEFWRAVLAHHRPGTAQ